MFDYSKKKKNIELFMWYAQKLVLSGHRSRQDETYRMIRAKETGKFGVSFLEQFCSVDFWISNKIWGKNLGPKGKIFNNFYNLRRNGHNMLYAITEHGTDARQMWI